jgi:proteasome lid subunit RPN8/RPN11
VRGELVVIICPNCDKGALIPNENYLCEYCHANFIKVGRSVYIREDALQNAEKIVEETDKRLGEIVREKGVEALIGNEGEMAGVVSGRVFGSIIFINDFFLTGTPGPNGYSMEPVLALDENKEKSNLLQVIKRLYAEKRLEVPLLLLHHFELDEIRKEVSMNKERFTKELTRLIKAGQERKIGTFHSHESSAPFPSDQDIRIMKFKDELEGDAYGKNDLVEVIISGYLVVFKKVVAKEIGKIPLTNSASYDLEL